MTLNNAQKYILKNMIDRERAICSSVKCFRNKVDYDSYHKQLDLIEKELVQ